MTALADTLLEHYERFTSVLCLAAQYGADERREKAYGEIRNWMRAHRDAIVESLGQSAVSDALLEFFDAETLQSLLDRDDGALIENVGRVSESLYGGWESA